jgi:hypothetical protein
MALVVFDSKLGKKFVLEDDTRVGLKSRPNSQL